MAIVIYARKSVERENSISCETQIEYCKAMIKPDERSEKIITLIDNGFSGGNVNRDGFQKMMTLIQKGKVSKVVVYKLDRISRSLSDFVNILQEFKEHKVEFVSSQESFDTSSPYGELIIKLLMVFAEFERTSIINRVTQAYAHRSELGFYMGGRQPYGFELVPAFIHNKKTKMLSPIPAEIEQIRYIFEIYAGENVSLRRLQDILLAEGRIPLNGSDWTTAKISAILKNPIYVRADSEIYDYYEHHGVRMITDNALFTGEYGAQLYGRSKHRSCDTDWSDMKLVLMTHRGVVDSDIWLKCQRKLEKNKQLTNSFSNPTSWLAGKVICKKCGHTMTTIKGKINKNGEIRRYFNCTGKTHKKNCTGPDCSVYAEDLENMVYDCISGKLSEIKGFRNTDKKNHAAEVNDLKLKIKAVEKAEKQLMDTLLSGGCSGNLLELANQRAAQLENEKTALYEKIEKLNSNDDAKAVVIEPTKYWRTAGYEKKKSVAMIMIHQIIIDEKGNAQIVWNI
ncbi:MAG: recombinase family protein [Oscillospiraceae bacterium]|nr:recombinase family protein [Oscillospiraceae bacterium]